MNVMTTPRWNFAEAEAYKLAKNYSAPPIPVYEIAEQNGANVLFVDFGPNSERVSGLCDFAAARIYVNKLDHPQRQAFTIAHELGHWMLHREYFLKEPEKYPVLARFGDPDKDNPMEKEANKFAACLLVPSHLLKPVLGASVSALAEIFGVSRTMMEFCVQNAK